MVKSEILDRAQDSTVIKIATFTRVAPQAPAQAYALITAADLSLLRKFDCYVNQLSAGAGPLVDALKGQDVEKLQQSIALEAYRQHLFEDLSRTYMNADATEKMTLEGAFETAKTAYVARMTDEDGCAERGARAQVLAALPECSMPM